MDQTMLDVTDIPDVSEGDEVIILGKQGDNEISMYDVCKWADTIPNDILTSFKERINKTYLSRQKWKLPSHNASILENLLCEGNYLNGYIKGTNW